MQDTHDLLSYSKMTLNTLCIMILDIFIGSTFCYTPDFVILYIYMINIHKKKNLSPYLCIMCGIVYDIYHFHILGITSLVYLITDIRAKILSNTIIHTDRKNVSLHTIITIIVIIFVKHLIYLLYNGDIEYDDSLTRYIVSIPILLIITHYRRKSIQ